MKRTICIILAAVMLLSSLGAALADTERVLTSADDWTVITLDPGHGGNGGAGYKYNGVWYNESELVLKIANYLKAELETYYHVRVVMTRTTNTQEEYDRVYDIANRFDIGQSHCSDIYVSLHLNGDTSHRAKGASVIVPTGNYKPELTEKDRELARCILSHLNEAGLSTYNTGLFTRSSEDGTRYPNGSLADYYQNTKESLLRNMVAVLIEHCFIDNYQEASTFLFTDAGLKKLAHADCLGIAEYLHLEKATAEQLAESANEYFLTDYRSGWAKDYIDRAISEGWVKGYLDDTFRPLNTVTRGEFVTFLGRAAGVEDSCTDAPFPDVPADKFCAAFVKWAADNDIVSGFEDGLFRSDEKITREQIAKIMTRYLEYLGCDVSCDKTLEDFGISDSDSIGEWAMPYVAFCYEKGLLQGTTAGTFEPTRSANRAEACAVLVRLADYAAANLPEATESN